MRRFPFALVLFVATLTGAFADGTSAPTAKTNIMMPTAPIAPTAPTPPKPPEPPAPPVPPPNGGAAIEVYQERLAALQKDAEERRKAWARSSAPRDQYVHGYTRKDGTQVQGYYRQAP